MGKKYKRCHMTQRIDLGIFETGCYPIGGRACYIKYKSIKFKLSRVRGGFWPRDPSATCSEFIEEPFDQLRAGLSKIGEGAKSSPQHRWGR